MEPSSPFLDIQEMVREIRERVRSELAGSLPAAAAPSSSAAAVPPHRAAEPAGVPAPNLARLHDATRRMQRAAPLVGHMPPQPPGLRARAGAVLVRFVQRMLFWYTPQIGLFHRAVVDTADEQLALIASLARDLRTCADAIRALRGELDAERSRAREWEARVERGMDALDVGRTAVMQEELKRLQAQQDSLAQELREARQTAGQVGATVSVQDRRLSIFLEEAARRLPESFSEQQVRSLAEEDRFDSLYARFEDTFRGARSDIKDRLRVYLPMLQDAGLGFAETPALDLGCGRGEWLELLGEHELHARGVDASRAMIARCEARGLPAFRADALGYLRSLPPASLGLVTAFHLVEHLPTQQLIAVLDETARVLKPGGLAIFETPNPDNLLVGATTFYQDLTHIRPLPSNVLKFLAEARGLSRVQVLPLHPYPENYHLLGDERGLAQRLNELFYGPRDYAIIGQKL